ncbi:hypothetical protein [Paenarthrobacter aromaticivorans]|uniref:hypothetical protein n=1 Tax=Paenarthrobacter aromaticivorans TaxID=2849150 RepID=UPI003A7FB8F4
MSQTYYPVQDWTELAAKDIVRVIEPGRAAYRATIDMKTLDSSVVWIITDIGYRRAFDAREGVRIVAASTKVDTTFPVISSGMQNAMNGRT